MFLKFTDPDDGTPVYVRASRVEVVYEQPDKTEAPYGLHPALPREDVEGYTGVRTFSGGSFCVTESAEDVAAELNRSGR